jgi:hypothetical protein
MISAPVTGLLCGQTYHFRARGTNVAGTTYGSDLTFQTLSCPGAAFYTLQSCRILDTRNASGPDAAAPSLSASQERVFDTATVTRCGIPASARALVVNVAAVSAAAQGSLALFPGGTTWPGNSSLSFNAGQTRSNNTVASLGGSGGLTVRNGSTGIVHIVVDVFGYFQ